jgi:hypothetical protein
MLPSRGREAGLPIDVGNTDESRVLPGLRRSMDLIVVIGGSGLALLGILILIGDCVLGEGDSTQDQ